MLQTQSLNCIFHTNVSFFQLFQWKLCMKKFLLNFANLLEIFAKKSTWSTRVLKRLIGNSNYSQMSHFIVPTLSDIFHVMHWCKISDNVMWNPYHEMTCSKRDFTPSLQYRFLPAGIFLSTCWIKIMYFHKYCVGLHFRIFKPVLCIHEIS